MDRNERYTRLIEVVDSCDLIALKNFLVENPSDVNLCELNHTALIRAVLCCSVEMVELLLMFGANPNICAVKNNMSPLEAAVYRENLHIAEILLKHQSDPNHLGTANMPILYHALAEKCGGNMIELLISNGANPNILIESRITLMEFARKYFQEQYEGFKNIVEKYGLIKRSADETTSLSSYTEEQKHFDSEITERRDINSHMQIDQYWQIIDGLSTNNSIADRFYELGEVLKLKDGRELFYFKFITVNLQRKLILCDFKEILDFLYSTESNLEIYSDALSNAILMGSEFYGKIIANPHNVTEEEKLVLADVGEDLDSIVDRLFDYFSKDSDLSIYTKKLEEMNSAQKYTFGNKSSYDEFKIFTLELYLESVEDERFIWNQVF